MNDERKKKIKDLVEAFKSNLTYEDVLEAEAMAEGYVEGLKDGMNIGRWTPCEERLPEDVQICDEYPTVIFCTKENTYAGFYEHYLGGRWWAEDGDYVVDEVTAWMPLPEPWKGADDETD